MKEEKKTLTGPWKRGRNGKTTPEGKEEQQALSQKSKIG